MIRRDLTELYRAALIAAAAVAGVVLIGYVLTAIVNKIGGGGGNYDDHGSTIAHTVIFAQILFVGGFIVTSRAFHESHDNTKNHEWFMLPASTVEKLIVRLLLSTIGYTVAVIAGYFLATALSAAVAYVITGVHFGVFNPFSKEVLLSILHYWVAQSIFLLGAAYFKKLHIVKTVLAMILIGIGISIVSGLVFYFVFSGYFDAMQPTSELIQLFENFDNRSVWIRQVSRTARTLRTIGEVLYWAALAPTCWIIVYFRLRETEVSHGV